MGGTAVARAVDFADVQGLVRYGHGRLTDACYLLLRIKEPRAARQVIAAIQVATAVEVATPPSTAMQIAFTAAGLRAFGVRDEIVAGFSDEFISGMAADASRSRRLGDAGPSDPSNWTWGTGDREPHVLLALFALPGALESLRESLKDADWSEAFEEIACLDTTDLHGFEQFGFTDGVSQPAVDWGRIRELHGDKPQYGNTIGLGEVLLGYPNEYGRYTERPLLDDNASTRDLEPAEDYEGKRDVGRNGTYLVMRDLRQDVRSFWQFLYHESERLGMSADELGAMLVGRRRNGDPLVPSAETSQNAFTYSGDPTGTQCPFAAHIRRTNPRNGDFPSVPGGVLATAAQMLGFRRAQFHDDLTSSTRFHRIIRRGREYGPALSPEDAQNPAPAGDPPRGLRFVCLNANIERQFEFLQNAWLINDKFNGLANESDPLLGNRELPSGNGQTDAFVIRRNGGTRTRMSSLPQFVSVTGGAYFFLPGLRALRFLMSAAAGAASG